MIHRGRQPRPTACCAEWRLFAALWALPLIPCAADSGGAAPKLVSPTQGRPAFVAPGDVLRVTVQLPPREGAVRFELIARGTPQHQHLLSSEMAPAGQFRFDLKIPEDIPEQTYDLQVRAHGATLTAPHAVAVRRPRDRIRLVHLSNMNIGGLGAPTFDPRLIDEVNLFNPTLIVITGDLLDATHEAPDAGWTALCDKLAEFDAPTLVACGDHDSVPHYSQHLAPSPVGAVEFPGYRGLVLYDLPKRPIIADPDQIAWVERTLQESRGEFHFIVSHDECPNLLQYWQNQGTLEDMIRRGRIGLWFSGGHQDWDGREYRRIVDAAAPLAYLRTHQSSPATRDGALGVSHYRVVDVEGGRATFYGPPGADGIPGSIAVGRLSVRSDANNDGQETQVRLTASSRLPFPARDLTTRVVLRRSGDDRPWCVGGRIDRLVALPGQWLCWVTFNLPDKGTREIVVGTGSQPTEPRVEVHFVMPDQLVLREARSEDGVRYLAAENWLGVVQLQNVGKAPVEISPLVYLDGASIAYAVAEEDGPVAAAYRLRLGPDQVVSLKLDLSAVEVSAGRRTMQVYLRGGAALAPVCRALDVRVQRAAQASRR